jgi:hypothetical protein
MTYCIRDLRGLGWDGVRAKYIVGLTKEFLRLDGTPQRH